MIKNIPEELSSLISSIKGLKCWHVSCGGAGGSTFQLAFGEKIRRPIQLKNSALPEEFRQFEAEMSLFVWCAWRLDDLDHSLTSWDDTRESIETELSNLVGAQIESIEMIPPVWDMNIKFSNHICLHVFCDHVPGDPSFDGNWDFRNQKLVISVGPGTRYRVEYR